MNQELINNLFYALAFFLSLQQFFDVIVEWLEDKNDGRRNVNKNSIWNNFGGSTHAYTTGRRHIDSNLNKIRPKGPSQTLKVCFCNMKNKIKPYDDNDNEKGRNEK